MLGRSSPWNTRPGQDMIAVGIGFYYLAELLLSFYTVTYEKVPTGVNANKASCSLLQHVSAPVE